MKYAFIALMLALLMLMFVAIFSSIDNKNPRSNLSKTIDFKNVANKVKNDMVENVEDIRNRAKMEKQELEKRLFIDKEKVRKVVRSAKNSLDKTTIEVNNAVKSL